MHRTVNFHKYLSFFLIKTGALILLFHRGAALHLSKHTTESHRGWHQRKIFAVFLCCSVTDINIESTFIFFQLPNAAQMMFKHPAPRI